MRRHIATAAALTVMAMAAGCAHATIPKVATAQGAPQPSSTASPMPSPAADEGDRALQFQQCMHDHGVDVQTGPKGDIAVQASPADKRRAITATEACQAYLPGGGEKMKLSPDDIEKLRQFSQCIRDHGYPDWPDPDPETGQMKLDSLGDRGADLKSDPQFQRAIQACESLAPGGGQSGAKGGKG